MVARFIGAKEQEEAEKEEETKEEEKGEEEKEEEKPEEEKAEEEPEEEPEEEAEEEEAEKEYYTSGGRVVRGGGGITPDWVMEVPEWTDFQRDLEIRSIFFTFAVHYTAEHPSTGDDFKVDDGVLGEFREFLDEKEFEYGEDDWTAENTDYVKLGIYAHDPFQVIDEIGVGREKTVSRKGSICARDSPVAEASISMAMWYGIRFGSLIEAASATVPERIRGRKAQPPEGTSLLPHFGEAQVVPRTLFWEHEGNRAIRIGDWKLVAGHNQPWELYDLSADRSELSDLAEVHPGQVRTMQEALDRWFESVLADLANVPASERMELGPLPEGLWSSEKT